MAEEEQANKLDALSETVARLVQAGTDVEARIRELTLAEFSAGRLDPERIRQVTRAVLAGIATSADANGGNAVQQSLDGVGAALLSAAEASKLAIEEAAGRAAEFSRQDLKRAVDDLATIEQLFVDTLREVATRGGATASTIFTDYIEHIRRSNDTLGRGLQEILGRLGELLPEPGRSGLQTGMEAAQDASERMARLAGSLLAGLRDGLSQPYRDNDRDAGRYNGEKPDVS